MRDREEREREIMSEREMGVGRVRKKRGR